jgi:hypothetical protein
MTKDGVPVDGGTVRIPLRFVLPKDPPPGAPEMPSLQLASRCYSAAADKFQRDATNGEARAYFFMWRMLLEFKFAALKLSPAELDSRFADLRTQPGSSSAPSCEHLIGPKAIADFDNIIKEAGDKVLR